MSCLPLIEMRGCCPMRKDDTQTRLAEAEGAITWRRRHRKEEAAIALSGCATESVPAGKQQGEFFATVGSSGPVDILILKTKNTKNRRKRMTYFPVNLRRSQLHFFLLSHLSGFFCTGNENNSCRSSWCLPTWRIVGCTFVFVFLFFGVKISLLHCLNWNFPALKSIQAEKKCWADLCASQ